MTMVFERVLNVVSPGTGNVTPAPQVIAGSGIYWLLTFDDTRWPVGGSTYSWGWARLFASPD
jgi:hypothetical protein